RVLCVQESRRMSMQPIDPRQDGASPAPKRKPKAKAKRALSKAEIERRRRKRKLREQQVRAQLAGRLNDDNAMLTREEWRVLNHLSERTGRRILSGPPDKRPVLTQLSPQRDGISVGNNRRWQQARSR